MELENKPLNKTVVDPRLLKLLEPKTYQRLNSVYQIGLKVHVMFEEVNATTFAAAVWQISSKHGLHAPGSKLAAWTGQGESGETFALLGQVLKEELPFLSNVPGVKYIWLQKDLIKTYENIIDAEAKNQEPIEVSKVRYNRNAYRNSFDDYKKSWFK